MSEFYLGKKSLSNLIGVHPQVGFLFVEGIKISPVDFTVFDGIRNEEQQQRMVDNGASDTLDSYHKYGLAVDAVAWINGHPRFELEPNKRVYAALHEVVKAHGLDMQCLWDIIGADIYHWQLTGYKDRYDIRQLDLSSLPEA